MWASPKPEKNEAPNTVIANDGMVEFRRLNEFC